MVDHLVEILLELEEVVGCGVVQLGHAPFVILAPIAIIFINARVHIAKILHVLDKLLIELLGARLLILEWQVPMDRPSLGQFSLISSFSLHFVKSNLCIIINLTIINS